MIFNHNVQWFLIKMANDLQSNAIWSTTLCIYLLPILPIYLPTYYPPTHLHIIYTFSPTYLPTYICSPSYNLPIYLPTYLHIIHLPIHPFTYLSLTIKCSRYV
jgi:hypothetical protein